MSTRPDPYSLPMSAAWVGAPGGQRFTISNRALRDPTAVPRIDRVLEITCGTSVIAAVHPRGQQRRWRLQLLDTDQHLWPSDAPPATDEDTFRDLGLDPPDDRGAHFRCVCGRLHVLDRDLVLAAAERLEPAKPRARRVDFRTVARVLLGPGT